MILVPVYLLQLYVPRLDRLLASGYEPKSRTEPEGCPQTDPWHQMPVGKLLESIIGPVYKTVILYVDRLCLLCTYSIAIEQLYFHGIIIYKPRRVRECKVLLGYRNFHIQPLLLLTCIALSTTR